MKISIPLIVMMAFSLLAHIELANSTEKITMDKKGTLEVKGKLVDEWGKPRQQMKVLCKEKRFESKGIYHSQTHTKSDGSFTISKLLPETEYVVIIRATPTTNEKTIEIKGDVSERKINLSKIVVESWSSPIVVLASGVIKDKRNDLDWTPDQGIVFPTWGDAAEYASTLKIDHGGWRLPTIVELRALYLTDHGILPIFHLNERHEDNVASAETREKHKFFFDKKGRFWPPSTNCAWSQGAIDANLIGGGQWHGINFNNGEYCGTTINYGNSCTRALFVRSPRTGND